MDFDQTVDQPINADRSIVSICCDVNRTGCAIYSDCKLKLIADRKDNAEPFKGLDIIIERASPEIVIVSSVQKKLIDFIEKKFPVNIVDISKRPSRGGKATQVSQTQSTNVTTTQTESTTNWLDNNDLDPLTDPSLDPFTDASETTLAIENALSRRFTLLIVANYWFSLTKGLETLMNSEMVLNKGLKDPEDKSLYVTSKINKSIDICAIRAVSSIHEYIKYLTRKSQDSDTPVTVKASSQFSQQLQSHALSTQLQNCSSQNLEQPSNNPMPIMDVQYIDPGPVLSLDKSTIESLSIFRSVQGCLSKNHEIHEEDPDIEKIPTLYELLNQCQSMQGKRHLRTMMMWPLQDINELRHRHDTVEYFINLDNRIIREQLIVQMKNNVPLNRILLKLGQSVSSYREMAVLYKALWSYIAMIDLVQNQSDHNLIIFSRIKSLDSTELRNSINTIVGRIDFECSRREKRLNVHWGVDQDIDQKREIYTNLAKYCADVANQETLKYKNVLNQICRVLYIPRIGFLNSVEYTSTSEMQRIRANPLFDVLLHTEQAVYFKTARMEELDQQAGDIVCDIIDAQEDLLVDLQQELLKQSDTILKLMEIFGELDCLIAFALVSSERNYTRPEMVSTSVQDLKIHQAYHPLCSSRYNAVPNDVIFRKRLDNERAKVMILTGPNACGKTTYMKTTCLVVYMAHIGCFVPASHATIPVVDAILTRMDSANSVSTGMSTFATDLHQINYALNKATKNSLIVIDEFGKGTQASDGFHLLKGLVMFFANAGMGSPYVMISSHFIVLVDYLQSCARQIIYRTFKVTRNLSKESIVYQYQVMDGVGEMTLADEVAIKAGVPHYIIERAKQVRASISENRPVPPVAPRAA